MGTTPRIKALETALELISAIPENRTISVTELSNTLGITKSAVTKILATYGDYGFVVQDDNKEFRLGPAILSLGAKAMRGLDIRSLVKPYLHRLTDNYNENSMLMIQQRDEAIIVEYVEAKVSVRLAMQMGQHHKLYYGAAPKLILAHKNPKEQKDLIDGITFEQKTAHTISSREGLYRSLDLIINNGFCYSCSEFDNAGIGLAVPVWDSHCNVNASIAMNVPIFRLKDTPLPEMILAMKKEALDFSVSLGADKNKILPLLHRDRNDPEIWPYPPSSFN